MGQKYSKQKNIIKNILYSTNTHPSAEWIYNEVKKLSPSISLATVYRNLSLLVSSGEIIKILTDDSCEHFDACVDNHYHFICTNCRKIFDISLRYDHSLDISLSNKLDVEISKHSLVFYGICKNCREDINLQKN